MNDFDSELREQSVTSQIDIVNNPVSYTHLRAHET